MLAVVAVRELAILVEPVGYKNNTDFYHCVSIEKWVDGCGSASEEPRLENDDDGGSLLTLIYYSAVQQHSCTLC